MTSLDHSGAHRPIAHTLVRRIADEVAAAKWHFDYDDKEQVKRVEFAFSTLTVAGTLVVTTKPSTNLNLQRI